MKSNMKIIRLAIYYTHDQYVKGSNGKGTHHARKMSYVNKEMEALRKKERKKQTNTGFGN